MKLYVNNQHIETQASNIFELLAEQSESSPQNIAIALNGEVIHKQAWDNNPLNENDRVDIFTAIAGG